MAETNQYDHSRDFSAPEEKFNESDARWAVKAPEKYWADFGDMEIVSGEHLDDKNATWVVGVKDLFRKEGVGDKNLEQYYRDVLAEAGTEKAVAGNNGIYALIDSDPATKKIKVRLARTTTPYGRELFDKYLKEKGYKAISAYVPHSSDAGTWMSRVYQPGEGVTAYGKRMQALSNPASKQ